jgi:hypothetical protein
MKSRILAAFGVALITIAAAPKKTPQKAPAAKEAAAHGDAAAFDPQNPQNLAALLSAAGGKAVVARQDEDAVMVTVASTAADFSMQFAGCDAHGRACKAVVFDNLTDQAGPTFAQLNAFNQSSALCRGYEDKGGKPHVTYSTLLLADDTKARVRQELLAWTGCIGEFRNFLRDPNAYLAAAP